MTNLRSIHTYTEKVRSEIKHDLLKAFTGDTGTMQPANHIIEDFFP